MKTKNWIITILVLGIALTINATEHPKMNILPIAAQKALVEFEAPSSTSIEVTITNVNGDILYHKKTKTVFNEYRKVFNFADLGRGTYNVCLNYGGQSINRSLTVSKNNIKVGLSQRLFEPYFILENKNLNVSFFNVTQKNVYLNLYKDGEHITRINLGKDLGIQKRINMSDLQKGEYEVTLTDWFKEHKANVKI